LEHVDSAVQYINVAVAVMGQLDKTGRAARKGMLVTQDLAAGYLSKNMYH
jgi:hypothetical protein